MSAQLSERILARRYAAAFYQHAALAKREEAAAAELQQAHRALSAHMAVFRNPRVSASEKKALLRRHAPSLSAETARFLELLIDKKRFSLLPQAAAAMARILDDGKGVVRASVRSAAELSAPEAEALRKALGRFSGKDVALDVKTDPELLAGVVVRMGDWVLDGSLKGQLRQLGERLAR